jgi:hypothetical protein
MLNLKNNVAILQKIKYRITIWPSNCSSGYMLPTQWQSRIFFFFFFFLEIGSHYVAQVSLQSAGITGHHAQLKGRILNRTQVHSNITITKKKPCTVAHIYNSSYLDSTFRTNSEELQFNANWDKKFSVSWEWWCVPVIPAKWKAVR